MTLADGQARVSGGDGRPSREIRGRLEHGGSGLLVVGQVWGKPVGCLVDTGATVNILGTAWWEAHGRLEELQETKGRVFSVDGRPMTLYGRVCTEITLGGRSWPITFEVADIGSEAIVGAAFLRENRFWVDIAGTSLWWGDAAGTSQPQEHCRLVASSTAVIAPGSEAMVQSYVVGEWPDDQEGLVEGLREVEMKRRMLVGRGLVIPEGDEAPVRVFNPGQEPLVIYRDMALASLEAVEPPGGEEGLGDGRCRMVAPDPGPGNDREKAEIIAGLASGTTGEQRAQLEQLLWQHQAAFQLSPGDMGRAQLVEHRIRTGDHAPVKQGPRRLAPHRRALVDTEVDKMLASGTIEPAEGPWASPVVLVKKKMAPCASAWITGS